MSVTFSYSSMNAGKSLLLLKAKHDYESVGKRVVCLTPSIYTRDGEGVIKSRALKESIPAIKIKPTSDLYSMINTSNELERISLILSENKRLPNLEKNLFPINVTIVSSSLPPSGKYLDV